MRRFSLRGYFGRHPAVTLTLACLLMIYAVVLSVQRLLHARGTVHADWALTVAVGLAASLTLTGVIAGWFWWAHRRRIRASPLGAVLFFGLAGVFMAGMVYTRPAVMPRVGPPETVTTAFQLGAIAFMIPLYGGLAALIAWMYLRLARNRNSRPGRHAAVPAAPGRRPGHAGPRREKSRRRFGS